MQTLEALGRKIRTAHDLLGVVKTMKSLAAVSIRQYERAVESLEAYRRVIDAGWRVLLRHGVADVRESPLKGAVCMIIASDQGMCGQFNEAILKHALAQAPGLAGEGSELAFWTFGEKLRGALADAGYRDQGHFAAPGSLSTIHEKVRAVIQRIEQWRSEKGTEHFYICHNVVIERGGYRQVCVRLLPLDRTWALAHAREKWPGRCIPMLGLPGNLMFKHLLRQYLFAALFRAFAQSLAGENAARLMAMQAAEKNILELLDNLQAGFRELRQNSITDELLDIISGFEALNDENPAL
ncbi:ATPase F1F0 subunit gamma [Desulfococcus multivorans]|nr:F0F1 ATP synthase subunit gamma [Desulfococcus multivorans]AQU99349.1 ATPase F1F0 subunit gamma [Desulfococcus multivorans]MDX9817841.1 F0F1 ATP synthase subunit gamma [Desulfococcus multivorans]